MKIPACVLSLCFSACFAYGEESVFYVSVTGDDANGGMAAAPFRTIAKALEMAPEGSEIRVAGGLYEESLESSKSSITLCGSYNADFTGRDLVGGRTVIKAPDTSSACYTVSGERCRSEILICRNR